MAELTVKRLANGRTVRQFFLALALLSASIAVCWSYQREIYSRLAGPFVATVAELSELASLDGSYRRLFEVNAANPTRLPFRDVTVHTRRGRETGRSYKYFFLIAGPKRPLLLRASVDSLAFPVIGALTEMPADVRDRIAKVAPKLMEGPGIAPVLLDVEDPVFSFDGVLAMAAAVAPVLFLGLALLALFRLLDFRRVPGVAALKRYGEPVAAVVAQIDGELRGQDATTQMRNVKLTPSWLLHSRRSKLDIVRLDDLVWVYSSVTTKKLYNLIPYSWSYALHLADRNGKALAIKGRKKQIPEVANSILQRVPWVIAGFSDEIARVYRRDRKLMVEAVEQRRQQVMQPAPQGHAGDGPTSPAPSR